MALSRRKFLAGMFGAPLAAKAMVAGVAAEEPRTRGVISGEAWTGLERLPRKRSCLMHVFLETRPREGDALVIPIGPTCEGILAPHRKGKAGEDAIFPPDEAHPNIRNRKFYDSDTYFHANHSNLGSTALSTDSLNTTHIAMMDQPATTKPPFSSVRKCVTSSCLTSWRNSAGKSR